MEHSQGKRYRAVGHIAGDKCVATQLFLAGEADDDFGFRLTI